MAFKELPCILQHRAWQSPWLLYTAFCLGELRPFWAPLCFIQAACSSPHYSKTLSIFMFCCGLQHRKIIMWTNIYKDKYNNIQRAQKPSLWSAEQPIFIFNGNIGCLSFPNTFRVWSIQVFSLTSTEGSISSLFTKTKLSSADNMGVVPWKFTTNIYLSIIKIWFCFNIL